MQNSYFENYKTSLEEMLNKWRDITCLWRALRVAKITVFSRLQVPCHPFQHPNSAFANSGKLTLKLTGKCKGVQNSQKILKKRRKVGGLKPQSRRGQDRCGGRLCQQQEDRRKSQRDGRKLPTLTVNKAVRPFDEQRIVFLTNGAGTTGHPHAGGGGEESRYRPCTTLHTTWLKMDHKPKYKTQNLQKPLEVYTGKNLDDLRDWQWLFGFNTKGMIYERNNW